MSNTKADFVLVLRSDYLNLCLAAEQGDILAGSGVHNWDAYDEAMACWPDIRADIKKDVDAMPAVDIVTCEECARSEPHCNWREAGARFCGLGKRREG